jgi:hypothetical protein
VKELGSERLVVGENDSGAVEVLDDFGHGEGLPGTGDSEEDLVALAVGEAADELGDGFGLVAAWLVVAG